MSDRRSGRARKAVDYSKFAGGDSDNDDDFKNSSTQPTKRKKAESTSPKSVKVKLTKLDVDSKNVVKKSNKELGDNEDNSQKKRLSVSDKVLRRQISEALEISKQDSRELPGENGNGSSLLLSGSEANEEEEESPQDDKKEADVSLSADTDAVATDVPPDKRTRGKTSKTEDAEWNDSSSSESDEEEEDASDWTDEDKETKVKKPVMHNKSFGNQDDNDGSDWSDDDGKNKNKKVAVKKGESKKQVKKSESAKVVQSSTPASQKCSRPSRKIQGGNNISPGLKSGTKTSGTHGLKPVMKTSGTPCQVISSPVKLPPKGLRLGLSKKVPGKPLHSVIKVQH